MIKNKLQLKITKDALKKFEEALTHVGEITNNARLLKVYRDAIESEIEVLKKQIEVLKGQIEEYERLTT